MEEIEQEVEQQEREGWRTLIYDYEGWVTKIIMRGSETRQECWHVSSARAQAIQAQKDYMCGEGMWS